VRLRLKAPARFDFARTVQGHGWWTLPPFDAPGDASSLRTTLEGSGGAGVPLRLTPIEGVVVAETPGRGDAGLRAAVRRAARRMLCLDLDLGPFHEAALERRETAWMAERCAGRLLRAPTGFEDLVKLVLTTNCSWSLTTRMVEQLIERWGARAADGTRAFPGPAALRSAGECGLRAAGCGYRAPLLAELARRVDDGEVDPESWDGDDRDPSELRAELLHLPGVGPYVAENVLRLAGRPDGPGLDSWLRAAYARVYHGGRRVTDRTIVRRYARFGRWSGLALWCDLTRDWFDE